MLLTWGRKCCLLSVKSPSSQCSTLYLLRASGRVGRNKRNIQQKKHFIKVQSYQRDNNNKSTIKFTNNACITLQWYLVNFKMMVHSGRGPSNYNFQVQFDKTRRFVYYLCSRVIRFSRSAHLFTRLAVPSSPKY